MSLYVFKTEEPYGGKIKIFASEEDAEIYKMRFIAQNRGKINAIIEEFDYPRPVLSFGSKMKDFLDFETEILSTDLDKKLLILIEDNKLVERSIGCYWNFTFENDVLLKIFNYNKIFLRSSYKESLCFVRYSEENRCDLIFIKNIKTENERTVIEGVRYYNIDLDVHEYLPEEKSRIEWFFK